MSYTVLYCEFLAMTGENFSWRMLELRRQMIFLITFHPALTEIETVLKYLVLTVCMWLIVQWFRKIETKLEAKSI